MIPKIIHRVSFGPNQPKFVDEGWELSQKINVGWEHLSHNYDNIDEFPISKSFIDLDPSYSFKSDLMRLEALYNWGGFYIDTDVFMIKSFDDLVNNDMVLLGNQSIPTEPFYFGSAVMASPPKNIHVLEMLKQAIEHAKEDHKLSNYSHLWNAFLPKVLNNYATNTNNSFIKTMPDKAFYPVPWTASDEESPKINKDESAIEYIERVSSFITSDSYCVHAWSGSWLSN